MSVNHVVDTCINTILRFSSSNLRLMECLRLEALQYRRDEYKKCSMFPKPKTIGKSLLSYTQRVHTFVYVWGKRVHTFVYAWGKRTVML